MGDNFDDLLDEYTDEETASKPWERDYTDDELADRKARRAAGEHLPGTKKHKTKYRRRWITDKDIELLTFIARFKYSTSRQLGVVSNTNWRTVHKRLLGLEEINMVRRVEREGVRLLWIVTQAGMNWALQSGIDATDADVRLMRPDDVSLTDLSHTLAVNQTAAWMMRGMPVQNNVPDVVKTPYGLDAFVSEYQVRSGWNMLLNDYDLTKMHRGAIGENNLRRVVEQVKRGEVSIDEFITDNPSLWTLAADNGGAKGLRQFKHPDLVLNRESLRTKKDSKPKSVAIEVELTPKPISEVTRSLRMYERDRYIYGHVLWVVNSNAMVKRLVKADKEVGLLKSRRMSIAPLIGNDGKPFGEQAWKL